MAGYSMKFTFALPSGLGEPCVAVSAEALPVSL
jgi:hypothetical protein